MSSLRDTPTFKDYPVKYLQSVEVSTIPVNIPMHPDPNIVAVYLKDVEDNPNSNENISVITRKSIIDHPSLATINDVKRTQLPLIKVPTPNLSGSNVLHSETVLSSSPSMRFTIACQKSYTPLKTNRKINIYFLRHGQSIANALKILDGYEGNSKLHTIGERQAKGCGEYLQNVKFDRVYSSDSTRATATCSIVMSCNLHNQSHILTPTFINLLRERMNSNEGLQHDEIKRNRIKNKRQNEIEPDADFRVRQESFLRLLYHETLKQDDDSPVNILVSTHGAYIAFFIRQFCNYSVQYVENCSVYVVQVQWYHNDSFINQNPVYHYRYVKHLTNNNMQKIPTNSKGASSRLPILITHPHVDYRESLTDYTTSFLADVHQYVTWSKDIDHPRYMFIQVLLAYITKYNIESKRNVSLPSRILIVSDPIVVSAHKHELRDIIMQYADGDVNTTIKSVEAKFTKYLEEQENSASAFSHVMLSVSYFLVALFEISFSLDDVYAEIGIFMAEVLWTEQRQELMDVLTLVKSAIEILKIGGYITPEAQYINWWLDEAVPEVTVVKDTTIAQSTCIVDSSESKGDNETYLLAPISILSVNQNMFESVPSDMENLSTEDTDGDLGIHQLFITPPNVTKTTTYNAQSTTKIALGVGTDIHICNSINSIDMKDRFPEPVPLADSLIYIAALISPATLEDYHDHDPMQVDPHYIVDHSKPHHNLQTDSGAIVSVIDYKTISHIGATNALIKRNDPLYLTSASNNILISHYYVPLRVTVKGTNSHKEIVECTAIVIFNVIPKLSTGILLGSDSMRTLGIINEYDGSHTIKMFKGADTLQVSYVTQKRLQESNSNQPQLSIHTLKQQIFTTYNERYNKVFSDPDDTVQYSIPDSLMSEVLLESQYARANPQTYMKGIESGRIQGSIAQVMAIYELHELYDITSLNERLHQSADGSLHFEYVDKPQNYIPPVVPLMSGCINALNTFAADIGGVYDDDDEDELIIKVYKETIHQMLQSYLPINSITAIEHHLTKEAESIEAIVEDTLQLDKDMLATQQEIADILNVHCTQELEELRPSLFPKHLWKYVFDKQKAVTNSGWQSFISESPPGRIEEVIKQILTIDISKENPARTLEEPLFMAQCLANIGRYAHPDLTNPPRAKGREYEINLTDTNPCDARMRRYSQVESAFLHHRIKQLVSRQMVGLSKSAYNSPPLCVPNIAAISSFMSKHGIQAMQNIWKDEYASEVLKFYRLVNDFRDLNSKTKLERWPLPYIMDLINRMKGSNRYSTGDIEDAFFTVNMKYEHRPFTAFSTPHGHYEYLCMGQGLKNAANFFARLVHEMFSALSIQGVPMSVYQDDVCNFANTLLHHLQVQQQIYDIMAENHLVFKPAKSHLNYLSQRILGHILSKRGRAPDPKLIETITTLATPKTLEGLRSLLGLAQVAREYIHELSTILQPIQDLTRKGVDVVNSWSQEQDLSFNRLKQVLTSSPVLGLPDVNKPFRVHVDACRIGKGIGAILLQQDEDLMEASQKSYLGNESFQVFSKDSFWRPVAYWSRVISKEERKYPATELECTALHDSILHWKIYLQCGCPFDTITDHYALVYMVTKMSPTTAGNNRLTKLCIELQGYTFGVTHRSGKSHIDADAVSRLLSTDMEYPILTEDQLRDDNLPPSDKELGLVDWDQWRIEDQAQIKAIIEQHQVELIESYKSPQVAVIENPHLLSLNSLTIVDRPADMTNTYQLPLNHINTGSISDSVYQCVKCTRSVPCNSFIKEGPFLGSNFLHHKFLQQLSIEQDMPLSSLYCSYCINHISPVSDELLCSDCLSVSGLACSVCTAYQLYCLGEEESVTPKESVSMNEYCLSVLYYIDLFRIMLERNEVVGKKVYPSIRKYYGRSTPNGLEITPPSLEIGYHAHFQRTITSIPRKMVPDDCYRLNFRMRILDSLYELYHDILSGSTTILCSIVYPLTKAEIDAYIQCGECYTLEGIIQRLRDTCNPIHVLTTVAHVVQLDSCLLAIHEGTRTVQQIVWLRELYHTVFISDQQSSDYSAMFQDMIECHLLDLIAKRWDHLILDNSTKYPDLVDDSDSDDEESLSGEHIPYMYNIINTIDAVGVQHSLYKFNPRDRINGYQGLQMSMRLTNPLNTIRTSALALKKSMKADPVVLLQQAHEDSQKTQHIDQLREVNQKRHKTIVQITNKRYKKKLRKQRVRHVQHQAREIITDIASNIAENTGVQVDYDRPSTINAEDVIIPVVITNPTLATQAINEGLVYIDEQCMVTSTELQEAYLKLNMEDNELAEAAAIIHDISPQGKQRKKRVSTLRTIKKNQVKPVNREVDNQLRMGRIRELEKEELTKYDYLVQKHYLDPTNTMLMLITNTYIDKESKVFMATAHPYDVEIQSEDSNMTYVQLPIHGDNGILQLVDKFDTAHNKLGVRWPVTQTDWLTEQMNDPYWKQILDKLPSEDKVICLSQQEEVHDYLQRNVLSDGMLGPLIRVIRRKKKVKRDSRIIEFYEEFTQMVVPKHLIYTCIELVHDGAGHPGRDRNMDLLRHNYYWDTMNNDCAQYIHDCTYCRNRKRSHDKGIIPLQSYLPVTRPNERVHMDCLTGLPTSNKYGYTGILILKDALTKWVELVPLRAISAPAITEGLINNYISRWGVPEQIVSDNGPEFANVMLSDILKILAAKNMHITARNPQANGLAENQVKTVKDMLASYIAADQRDWEDFYPVCQMFINSTVSQSTHFTPYMMTTGREMNQPGVSYIEKHLKDYPVETGEVYVRKLMETMLLMWELVSEEQEGKIDEHNNRKFNNYSNNNKQDSNNNNQALNIKSYEVNQYVFITNMPRRFYKDKAENIKYHINFKLQANRFVGPYRVKAKLSPVIYTLDIHGEDINMHIIHMKSAGNTSLKQRKAELNRKNYQLKKTENKVGRGDQNQADNFQNVVGNNNLEIISEDIEYYANDNTVINLSDDH